MCDAIVSSDEPITLVGGGEVSPGELTLCLSHAPLLVAADGGAGNALREGHVPHAVIGDLDSLRPEDRARIPADAIHRIGEQDSTDFDKALRSLATPLVLGVGFLGGRLDHQLAALSTLVCHPHRPCLLLGAQEVVFHAPAEITLPLVTGDTVSVYPLLRVTGRSRGLAWPIDGLELSPDGRVGTSNVAQGAVTLEMDGPGALVTVPRARLDAVVAAFRPCPAPDGSPPTWPVLWPAPA